MSGRSGGDGPSGSNDGGSESTRHDPPPGEPPHRFPGQVEQNRAALSSATVGVGSWTNQIDAGHTGGCDDGEELEDDLKRLTSVSMTSASIAAFPSASAMRNHLFVDCSGSTSREPTSWSRACARHPVRSLFADGFRPRSWGLRVDVTERV